MYLKVVQRREIGACWDVSSLPRVLYSYWPWAYGSKGELLWYYLYVTHALDLNYSSCASLIKRQEGIVYKTSEHQRTKRPDLSCVWPPSCTMRLHRIYATSIVCSWLVNKKIVTEGWIRKHRWKEIEKQYLWAPALSHYWTYYWSYNYI